MPWPKVDMCEVYDGFVYRVATSDLLAHDWWWDGRSWQRHFRNVFLYRTRAGRYFVVRLSFWEGEPNTLEPLSREEARALYEQLPVWEVGPEEAFPDSEPALPRFPRSEPRSELGVFWDAY